MIKKMLIAVDGSESSEKALDFALDIAEKCYADVQIVSVIPPIESIVPRFTPAVPPTQFQKLFIDYVENRLKTVLSEELKKARGEKPSLKISTRLLNGNPADEIVRLAKEEDFSVIVVGSRGLSGVEELLLGSVSDRIADIATCPVLIFK